MLTASLMPTVRRNTAASPAQAAPAAIDATTIRIMTSPPPSRSPSEMPIPPAATAPITICPSPPTLTSPALAGTTTASAPSSSGAALMKICSIDCWWVNVEVHTLE